MTAYFIICGIILSTKHNKKLKEKKKKTKEKTKTQNPPQKNVRMLTVKILICFKTRELTRLS
jgi:hypothetical protein